MRRLFIKLPIITILGVCCADVDAIVYNCPTQATLIARIESGTLPDFNDQGIGWNTAIPGTESPTASGSISLFQVKIHTIGSRIVGALCDYSYINGSTSITFSVQTNDTPLQKYIGESGNWNTVIPSTRSACDFSPSNTSGVCTFSPDN